METIQNHFVHITITRGRLIGKEDGSIGKIVDEVLKDDIFPFNDNVKVEKLARKLLKNGNLDFEQVQKEI